MIPKRDYPFRKKSCPTDKLQLYRDECAAMRRSERVFAWLWMVASLCWAGFIVDTRFRIGDGYATGFTLIDLAIIAGPPVALLLLGAAVALVARKALR
jgi:hypothetical protein